MVQGVLTKGIWGQGFKGSKSCEIYSGVPDMFWNLQTQTIPNAAPSTLKVLPLSWDHQSTLENPRPKESRRFRGISRT